MLVKYYSHKRNCWSGLGIILASFQPPLFELRGRGVGVLVFFLNRTSKFLTANIIETKTKIGQYVYIHIYIIFKKLPSMPYKGKINAYGANTESTENKHRSG